jgi:hypothetical protein
VPCAALLWCVLKPSIAVWITESGGKQIATAKRVLSAGVVLSSRHWRGGSWSSEAGAGRVPPQLSLAHISPHLEA